MIENTVRMVIPPKPNWQWDVFGSGSLVYTAHIRNSCWARFWTRIFFGSKWKRL